MVGSPSERVTVMIYSTTEHIEFKVSASLALGRLGAPGQVGHRARRSDLLTSAKVCGKHMADFVKEKAAEIE